MTDRELPAQWLRQAVRGRAGVSHCAPGAATAIAAQAAQAGAQVVLVDFGLRDGAAAQVQGLAQEAGNRLVVVGIGEDDGPESVLAAVRAGARDFLRIGSSADEVDALLDRLGAHTQASAARACRWFGVFGARPSADTTLLAAHLALALRDAAAGEGRVLLLDLGLPAGDAPLMLGATGQYTVADALRSVRRLDATLIDTAVPRHKGGLYVLSLAADVPPPALTGPDLQELLTVLGAHCTHAVVNLGGWADPDVLRAALRATERTALVAEATVPSARSATALLDGLRAQRTALDAMGLVLDGTYRGMQMVAGEVARGLELPLWAELPANPASRHLVFNRGESLFALRPKDAYAVRARALAEALRSGTVESGSVSNASPQRSVFDRVLGGLASLRGAAR